MAWLEENPSRSDFYQMQTAFEVYSQNRKKRHPKGPELFRIPFNFLNRFIRKAKIPKDNAGISSNNVSAKESLAASKVTIPNNVPISSFSPEKEQEKREQATKQSIFYKLMQMSNRNKGQSKPDKM